MSRKLVSIQVIKAVSPIEGADFIEKVSFVDIGWQCVAKKGEFTPGDKCVFFEIDSFLPIEDRYEFLRTSSYRVMYTGQEGFRLKTVKLKGIVSQGLCLPLSEFPELKDKEVGEDLTELVNVIKYEVNRLDAYELKGDFPSLIEKSDQDRIQGLLDYFEKYQDIEFEETMKLDGQSVTLFHFENEIGICGRNAEFKQIITVPQWKLTLDKGLDVALRELKMDIGLQFEFMGPKIQGNREGLFDLELYLYNIWDIKTSRFFKPSERNEIFEQLAERVKSISGKELKHTPILTKSVKIFEVCPTLEEILDRANGKSLNHKYREGNVYKSLEYIDNERIVQFKAISNQFLLKGGD
jgi:RNA ligase (TIGR02306 family)